MNEDSLRRWLVQWIAVRCAVAPQDVDTERPVAEYGLSSVQAVALAGELEDLLDRTVAATLLWERPTIALLARGLATQPGSSVDTAHIGGVEEPGRRSSDAARAQPPMPSPIAIVGIGCRFPGAATGPNAFWTLMSEQRSGVRTVPDNRWESFHDGSDQTTEVLSRTTRWGGFLDDLAGFDAEFFGITTREATLMDPQQRLLLEVSHEALRHAGIPTQSLRGQPVGVFVGISGNEYSHLTAADVTGIDAWTSTGVALSIAANRLSYVLDARGPSISVDTACSSSLVAVHLAVQSLRAGESSVALAAGVNVLLAPSVTVNFDQIGLLAADGRCRAFDAAADGTVRGEGAGVVVLKRLADAQRDGDRVLAVIRGTAINQDGRSNGLMAPNQYSQEVLLRHAYTAAGVDPTDVDYVEAHGTGTLLGDPIEARSLGAVLGTGRPEQRPLLIGSVKTNIGHLEAAAGVAGLIKVVLSLTHRRIPASLHFTTPNPHIPFDDLRLRVVDAPTDWLPAERPRLAGVSGFGFGGTNAHVIVEEAPDTADAREPTVAPGGVYLLRGSQPERVRDMASALADWLTGPGAAAPLVDLGHTLAVRRSGPATAAVVARDRAELTARLRGLAAGTPTPGVVTKSEGRIGRGPVWVFSGQGAQWPGMARGLLATDPTFAAEIDELEPLFRAEVGWSLRTAVTAGTELLEIDQLQPVLYGLQVALAGLWRSHGVEPSAVIGHSLGEVAAAVAVGAISAAAGLRIVASRSRVLRRQSAGGAMATVELPAEEVRSLGVSYPGVAIAGYLAPGTTVVTGDAGGVDRMVAAVERRGLLARLVRVNVAAHSPRVEPHLPELRAELADIVGGPANTAFYTTVLDDPRQPARFDADYWALNLRRPVRFAHAVAAAASDGYTTYIEISPHPILTAAIDEGVTAAGVNEKLVVGTLRRDADDLKEFHTQLAAVHLAGQPIAWERVFPGGTLVDVPAPQWRHTRHWMPSRAPAQRAPAAPPGSYAGTGAAEDSIADWSYALAAAPRPAGDATAVDFREHLFETNGAARHQLIADRIRSRVAVALEVDGDRLDATTSLVDAGVDSLQAARISSVLRHDFAVEVPVGMLLRGAGLAEVADWVAVRLAGPARVFDPLPSVPPDTRSTRLLVDETREAARSAVRTLAAAGNQVPLFLAHPGGGTTGCYLTLASLLGDNQPVYGLERLDTVATVEARASRYLELIREIQPSGPYRLGGWSFGGFLAYEIARQLTAAGASVEVVVMIDSIRPLPSPAGTSVAQLNADRLRGFADYLRRMYGEPAVPAGAALATTDERTQLDLVQGMIESVGTISPGIASHMITYYQDLLCLERYEPGGYSGPVLVYRAADASVDQVADPRHGRVDHTLGWHEVCNGRLSVVPISGDHFAVLDPPNVTTLARDLRGVLGGRFQVPAV